MSSSSSSFSSNKGSRVGDPYRVWFFFLSLFLEEEEDAETGADKDVVFMAVAAVVVVARFLPRRREKSGVVVALPLLAPRWFFEDEEDLENRDLEPRVDPSLC